MRSLGLFVGHVVRGVRSDPGPAPGPAPGPTAPVEPGTAESRRIVASHRVEQEHRDGVILRRTTI
ncbi:MAG: hypothetical protein ACYTEV_03835, partial [Planctomycetota bacterium]